ncbi:MAG: hypothetical protein IIA64_07825 [Planctomycetes bacterium]|nr:hypothetical protein [Planctomycetota bacterium]
MNEQSTWGQRFAQLPRAAQWALIGAVVIIALLIYTDFLWKFADDWNDKADKIRSEVRQAALTNSGFDRIDRMKDLISGVGPVVKPDKEGDANKALTQSVNAILKLHSVSNDDFKIRPPARLPTGTLERIVRERNQRVERLTGELRFDASPEHTLAIIAELESNEDIESISHVRLNKLPGTRKLSVRLTVEAWILSSVAGRRTGVSR